MRVARRGLGGGGVEGREGGVSWCQREMDMRTAVKDGGGGGEEEWG